MDILRILNYLDGFKLSGKGEYRFLTTPNISAHNLCKIELNKHKMIFSYLNKFKSYMQSFYDRKQICEVEKKTAAALFRKIVINNAYGD